MKITKYFCLFLVGCTDYKLSNVNTPSSGEEEEDCTESYINFDIEEVSTLQDAVSYSVSGWNQDAVVLQFDDSNLQQDQTWRVSAVEILVMIAADHYPMFVDGQEINVQVLSLIHI